MGIDESLLSKAELEYYRQQEGTYWDKKSIESRAKYREESEQEKRKLEEETAYDKSILMHDGRVFVPKFNVILEHPMDIAQLFSTSDRMSDFLNFLFSNALNKQNRGGDFFFYNESSKSYNFDYVFILGMIILWSSEVLGADAVKMKKYMLQFSVGKKRGYYLKNNYFLTSCIFGDMYLLSNKKYRGIDAWSKSPYSRFCNPSIVRAGDGNEYFYYSVPFLATEVLKYLDRNIVLALFEKRGKYTLEQLVFGKEAFASQNQYEAFVRISLG